MYNKNKNKPFEYRERATETEKDGKKWKFSAWVFKYDFMTMKQFYKRRYSSFLFLAIKTQKINNQDPIMSNDWDFDIFENF